MEALVAQNIYYVYPQIRPSKYGWDVGPNQNNIEFIRFLSSYSLKKPHVFFELLIKHLNFISSLPLVHLLFITFTWFALWVVLSTIILGQKRYHYLNIILLGLSSVLVGLISPVNGFI